MDEPVQQEGVLSSDAPSQERGAAVAQQEQEAPPPEPGVVSYEELLPPQEGDDEGAEAGASSSSLEEEDDRVGTTSSARFNILGTMVGGGSLSLPLAFQKTGNALLAPLFLVVVALITEWCFRALVASARTLSPVSPNERKTGKDSFESVAYAAFGTKAYLLSTSLVTAMCFFGTVGYAVLLRDMLQPISDVVFGTTVSGPTWANNATMFTVVLLVTPLCTLKTLTALKRFSATSMLSVLILGVCIVYRSLQCNLGFLGSPATDDLWLVGQEQLGRHHVEWWKTFKLWPDSPKDVLDAFPLFVSCYVCHYNILTVHNELRQPSVKRVGWWLRSTTWVATGFYMVMGIAGSAYGTCTATGQVQGNVLLDFSDDDPLLLVGRMCLAFTITMAFPMLTIPARDILIRSLPARWVSSSLSAEAAVAASSDVIEEPLVATLAPEEPNHDAVEADMAPAAAAVEPSVEESLREPLLADEEQPPPVQQEEEQQQPQEEAAAAAANGISNGPQHDNETETLSASLALRLVTAIIVFWSATLVASCVSSIDVVWDLLGSSLSILMSYLIPAGSYLVIARLHSAGSLSSSWKDRLSVVVAWILILVFVPLMVISTGNAIYDTFFVPSA